MDILRVLASPDLEVRKKTLNLGEFIMSAYAEVGSYDVCRHSLAVLVL
jgi:hypothetical protein